jgi:diguanylate cyclase (GGDEF)-like protein
VTRFAITRAFREPGFSRKLTLAFTAVILVVAMTLPVAFWAFARITSSTARAGESAQTLNKVFTMQRAIGDLRVTARDYAASGSPDDLHDLATHLNVITDQIRCIEAPTRCGADGGYSGITDQERLRWRQIIDSASGAYEGFKAAVRTGEEGSGLARFDHHMEQEVEKPAIELAGLVRARGQEARAEINHSVYSSGVMLAVVLGAALLVAIALAYWIPRSMMRKLDHLRYTAHLIAGGDLAARADEEGLSADEVAELFHDFNHMARTLQQRQEENERLQGQLHLALMSEQERSTRDPLTGLRNHRYFQDSLRAEIDRCRRTGSPVTIAVIDLDNFKQVNDRFGHHEGDAVLLRVTQGISDNLRPYDLACRLGGEEFGVIFPETEAAEATMVLDRIARHVVGFGPNGERATFSGGLATFPLHSDNQADLFQRADEAVYAAKSAGKAQTIIYDPSTVVAMDSEERMRQRSREAVLSTATTLVSAVDQKDPYTRHHSELTAIYAATVARALQLDEEQVKLVYRAALLHDVGKIGVADSILKKPGRLTEDEYAQVKMHPEFSFRILENAEMEPIATWTRHHHEHWDGSGYPMGLSGTDIPLGSRIILVADAFEAMTSDRIYRRALGTEQALQELRDHAGGQFDPQVAEIMVQLVTSGVFDQIRRQYGRHVEDRPVVVPEPQADHASNVQAVPPAPAAPHALPPGQQAA